MADKYNWLNPPEDKAPTPSNQGNNYSWLNPPENFPNSADQVQTPGPATGNAVLNAGKSLAIGAGKGAASVLDMFVTPTVAPISSMTGGNPEASFTDKADKYLPESPNKALEAVGSGATAGAIAGPTGAVIGGATAGGTKVLQEMGANDALAYGLPMVASVVAAPGTASGIYRVGRNIAEGANIVKRSALTQAKIDQDIRGAGTPASNTDDSFWAYLQRGLRRSPGGVGTFERAAENEQGQLANAVTRNADTLAPELSTQELGNELQTGLKGGVAAAKRYFQWEHNSIDAHIPPATTEVDMTPFISDAYRKLGTAPGHTTPLVGNKTDPGNEMVARLVDNITDYGRSGRLNLASIKKLKSDLGDSLEQNANYNIGDASTRQKRLMYGILADAEEAAYRGTPFETIARNLKREESQFYDTLANYGEKLQAGAKTGDKAALEPINELKLGDTKLGNVLDLVSNRPELRDQYASYWMRNAGLNNRGEFDPNRYFREWQRLSPEAKNTLFQPISKDMDQLALLSKNIGRGKTAINSSETAGTEQVLKYLDRWGALAGGAVGAGLGYAGSNEDDNDLTKGEKVGGGATVGAALGYSGAGGGPGAKILAKLMTNGAFLRWLATPTPIEKLPTHLKALSAIAAENHNIHNEVLQFQDFARQQNAPHDSFTRNFGYRGQEYVRPILNKLGIEPKGFAEGGSVSKREAAEANDRASKLRTQGEGYFNPVLDDMENDVAPFNGRDPKDPFTVRTTPNSFEARQAVPREALIDMIMKKYQLGETGRKNAEDYADELGVWSNTKGFEGFAEGGPANENEFTTGKGQNSLLDFMLGGFGKYFGPGSASRSSTPKEPPTYQMQAQGTSGYIAKPETGRPVESLWTTKSEIRPQEPVNINNERKQGMWEGISPQPEKYKYDAYHGTRNDIQVFREKMTPEEARQAFSDSASPPDAVLGHFFSKNPELANDFALSGYRPDDLIKMGSNISGQSVYPVKLRMDNPKVVENMPYDRKQYYDAIMNARELGHDGVIFKNTRDDYNGTNRIRDDVYVTFSPNQIKSKFATHFDENTPDITRATGGPIYMAQGGEVKPYTRKNSLGEAYKYDPETGLDTKVTDATTNIIPKTRGTRGAGETPSGEDPTSGPVTPIVPQITGIDKPAPDPNEESPFSPEAKWTKKSSRIENIGALKAQGDQQSNPLAGLDRLGRLILKYENGRGDPLLGTGTTDLRPYIEKNGLDSRGFPNWPGIPTKYGRSYAAGLFQITRENWHKYAPPGADFTKVEDQVATYNNMRKASGGQPWLGATKDGVLFNPRLVAAYNAGEDAKPGEISNNMMATNRRSPEQSGKSETQSQEAKTDNNQSNTSLISQFMSSSNSNEEKNEEEESNQRRSKLAQEHIDEVPWAEPLTKYAIKSIWENARI